MGNPGLGAGVLFVGEHERDARASGGGMFLFYCWVTVLVASIVLSAYKTTSLITNF